MATGTDPLHVDVGPNLTDVRPDAGRSAFVKTWFTGALRDRSLSRKSAHWLIARLVTYSNRFPNQYMSVVAEFTVKPDDFALNNSLTAVPGMIVEIERVVATLEDRVMPYFWVSGGDQSTFEDAFADDASVQNITIVDMVEGARLYRAE